MKKISIKKSTVFALVLMLAVLLMAGCFRKRIVSTPPSQQPAPTTRTATAPEPAPAPVVVEEEVEVVEETIDIEAPKKDEVTPAPVAEGTLDEEPLPEPAAEPAKEEAAAAATATSADEPVTTEPAKEEPAAELTEPDEEVDASDNDTEPMTEAYYVQVGAFSELANANGVLTDLIGRGYKGSRLSQTTKGLYQVQAGPFTDQATANEAMIGLRVDFPRAFIIKSTPTN